MLRLLALVLSLAVQEPKAPIPDAAAQKDAEKTIREVYKEQYAKKELFDRQNLARDLLQQASASDNPVAVRYVLLREAQSLGDLYTGLKAVDLLSRHYAVNLPALKLRTLNLSIPKNPEEFKPLAELYLNLVDEALQANEIEVADKAAQGALATVRKAKDIPMLTRAQAKVKEVADLRTRVEAIKKSEAALLRDPKDPAANLAVGLYECLVRGNWEAGLPMLAKTDQPALKAAAAADLALPAEPAKQIEAGDAWWTAGESDSGAARQSLRLRALYWYGRALPKSTGLTKLKIESRFTEMGRKAAEEPAGAGPFETDDSGFILNWLLVGPFPNLDDKGLDKDFLEGEATYVPSEGREVDAPGAKLKWAPYVAPGGRVEFDKVPHLGIRPAQPEIVVYAVCWVSLDSDQELQIRLGADDGYYLWVGERPVIRQHLHRGATVDQYLHTVKLTKGRHRIMIKVDQGGGGYEFLMRLTTPKGERLPGVKVWN